MDKYEKYSRQSGPYQMIELQQNFRSRESVLTSVNDVFYQIMTKNLGGITYTPETALYPGAVFEEVNRKNGLWPGLEEGSLTRRNQALFPSLQERLRSFSWWIRARKH